MNSDPPQEAEITSPAASAPTALRSERSESAHRPKQSLLNAQVQLLGDDSDFVVAAVRSELAIGGPRIEKALRRATQSEEPRLRIRARDLLAGFKRDKWLRRLIRAVSKPKFNLESSLFILGNLAADDFDARPYRRALNTMGDRARELFEAESDPRRAVLTLPKYLGQELGYSGATSDYHHPDNIHLFRVIERKAGMPLTLTMLYLLVARRAGIGAMPVALPGHVLLRLSYDRGLTVLIDPFQGGLIRTRHDCAEYLRKCNIQMRPEWFHDATDEAIFIRQLMNLSNSNRLRRQVERARQLKRIATILAHVQSHR
ncbi:MAG: regulator of sirC expression with transglutaminase-like and TPR domain [Planctomycetota bacterium]